jgi:hypothetical protein
MHYMRFKTLYDECCVATCDDVELRLFMAVVNDPENRDVEQVEEIDRNEYMRLVEDGAALYDAYDVIESWEE